MPPCRIATATRTGNAAPGRAGVPAPRRGSAPGGTWHNRRDIARQRGTGSDRVRVTGRAVAMPAVAAHRTIMRKVLARLLVAAFVGFLIWRILSGGQLEAILFGTNTHGSPAEHQRAGHHHARRTGAAGPPSAPQR